MDPDFDPLPHRAVEVASMRGLGIDIFAVAPQETRFQMKDGKRLLFYPDAPPVRVVRGGRECHRLHVYNEDQAIFVECAAVREVKSAPQMEVHF